MPGFEPSSLDDPVEFDSELFANSIVEHVESIDDFIKATLKT